MDISLPTSQLPNIFASRKIKNIISYIFLWHMFYSVFAL